MPAHLKKLRFLRPKQPSEGRALQRLSNLSKAHLGVFILVFAAIGGYFLLTSHAAGSTANLWISTTGGTCTRSASATVYSAGSACSSFQAAYNAAQSGDIVRVVCGDYSAQPPSFDLLTYTSNGNSLVSNVTFSSEDDTASCVTLPNGGFTISSPHVTVEHFQFDKTACVNNTASGYSANPCPAVNISDTGPGSSNATHDSIFDDLHASELNIAGPVYNITIKNSDFGPEWDYHGLLHCDGSASPCILMPHDIMIQNVTWHDFYNTTGCLNNVPAGCLAAHHEGCAMTINNGYNITEDSIHAYNCEDLPWYLNPYLSEVHDVTLENSNIGQNAKSTEIVDNNSTTGGFGFWNIRLINNTWSTQPNMLPSTTPAVCSGQSNSGGCEFLGNIGIPAGGCSGNGGFSSGWTVEFNASTTEYCGTGTLLGGASGSPTACNGSAVCQNNYKTSSYGLAANGYDLANTSVLNHILPAGLTWLPSTDIEGNLRSVHSSPGADDGSSGASTSSGPATGDLNSDGHVDVTDLSILMSHFGQSATPSQGDCNSDGIVNISDLSILLSHFGT